MTTMRENRKQPVGTETVFSPAKINLMLRVMGRRADGYHDLQTVFELLDWGDELEFSFRPAKTRGQPLTITGSDTPPVSISGDFPNLPVQRNLIWQAAASLVPHATDIQPVHIHVTKRLPAGGGVGGGSSNAAATLKALNHYWGCHLDATGLRHLGLKLGADVPVFLGEQPALATGVGEKLQPLALPRRFFVLVIPRQGLSTAEVFGHPQLPRDSQPLPLEKTLNPAYWRNDCLLVARCCCHSLAVSWEIVEKMHKQMGLDDFSRPRLSGTGSVFFMAFEQQGQALECAAALRQQQQTLGADFPAQVQVASSWRKRDA